MGEFLSWLNEIEYSTLEIPIPDMTLFLHMSPEIGQRLVDKKGERSYTDRKRDIHEEDLDHLQNAERAYLFCLDNDPVENWQRIVCFEGNEPRTIDDIHAEVYQKVIEKIK